MNMNRNFEKTNDTQFLLMLFELGFDVDTISQDVLNEVRDSIISPHLKNHHEDLKVCEQIKLYRQVLKENIEYCLLAISKGEEPSCRLQKRDID